MDPVKASSIIDKIFCDMKDVLNKIIAEKNPPAKPKT
jgi:hypothetical protein